MTREQYIERFVAEFKTLTRWSEKEIMECGFDWDDFINNFEDPGEAAEAEVDAMAVIQSWG